MLFPASSVLESSASRVLLDFQNITSMLTCVDPDKLIGYLYTSGTCCVLIQQYGHYRSPFMQLYTCDPNISVMIYLPESEMTEQRRHSSPRILVLTLLLT